MVRNFEEMASLYQAKAAAQVMPASSELNGLVDAARGGDVEAFGALFDRCYPGIYRYAYARLRSVSDAEDAAAETFASAFAALPRFRWRGVPFEAWLFRIAASKVVDSVRAATRSRTLALPDVGHDRGESRDPAELVSGAEGRAELLAFVDRLPGRQRDVIVLRFFADQSLEQVASTLGSSVGAVKQLQFRAMSRLRQGLGR